MEGKKDPGNAEPEEITRPLSEEEEAKLQDLLRRYGEDGGEDDGRPS